MLSRRQVIAAGAAPAVLTVRAAAQGATRIRQVDLVHHTHTDVGYTEFPLVIHDLQRRYLDAAIDACKADPLFRWTIESLVGLDDWWRASTPARRDVLLGLVASGQMDAMAMPFNQTPFLDANQWRQMMRWIPDTVFKQLHIRAAMQNDVNGMPRVGAVALLNKGVRHLLMGINADSGGPPFRRPSAFRWKMPDGRAMFVWLGEHYGRAMGYLGAKGSEHRMKFDETSLRAAQKTLGEHLRAIEAEGYAYDRLILTFTHPAHYDNGGPYPSVAPFVAAWNKLGLEPRLRLTTATDAVFAMEKALGAGVPVTEGEWTDWWANGDASGPREVAASRFAKRYVTAALSPLWGPVPAAVQPEIEGILKDLCLFDEHTWGASRSIREPYGLRTIAQYGQKSDLAYRPMGFAEKLLERRARTRIDGLPDGVHVANTSGAEVSGWASVPASYLGGAGSLRETGSDAAVELRKGSGPLRFWVEKLPARSIRSYRTSGAYQDAASTAAPSIAADASGWPRSATWAGMEKPLFDGEAGEFVCAGVIPPADRETTHGIHANPDAAKREEVRRKSFRQTAATAQPARRSENPHTVVYTQELRHERLEKAVRTIELWRREPRARVTERFDRIAQNAPEVFYIGFALPEPSPLPVFCCGGMQFTPYRDQIPGACRDYFGIDGWAHYAGAGGHRLWVTRDAPLVAVGRPHFIERHQEEPAEKHRIYAMVFDNCWHTNFVADSHGTMEFQFDLVWRPAIDKPADLAEALAGDPVTVVNAPVREEPAVIRNLYRG
jgi:hypothetical protein